MRSRRILFGSVMGVLLCALTACVRDEAYLCFMPIDLSGWDKTESLDFRIDSLPESAHYVPQLLVRKAVAGNYPYQSLTLEVRQRWVLPEPPPPQQRNPSERTYLVSLPQQRSRVPRVRKNRLLLERTDTVVCRFMTPAGDLIVGGVSLSQYACPLPPLSLPRGAEGRIAVRHLMLKEVVPGISDVGISLSASSSQH